ncbi:MAG: threonylcarbamoyl-AMP synthase, partial [Actinobacteria bacterium]
ENDIINKVSQALLDEELVILPTDTVYGLMALSTSDNAVSKLYEAKKRDRQKPTALLVDSIEAAAEYIGNSDIKKLGEKFWPGPLTIIAEAKKNIAGSPKLGVRVPDEHFLLKVLKVVDKPVMASSANIAGEIPPSEISRVSAELSAKVAIGIDKGSTEQEQASTIVEIANGEVDLKREGPITARQIEEVLNL